MAIVTQTRALTTRQRKISENIGNTSNYRAMKNAGYSDSYARSGHIKSTQGWQGMVDELLPDDRLLQVHRGLLQSKEWRAREAGLDKAYKLKKRYTEEFRIKTEVEQMSDEELQKSLDDHISFFLQKLIKEAQNKGQHEFKIGNHALQILW